MVKYSIQRILMAILTAFIILTLTFFLIKSLPFEKPVASDESGLAAYYINQVNLGYLVDCTSPSDAYGDLLWNYTDTTGLAHYYYQAPVLDQYASWLKGIFTEFNWGTSVSIDPNVDSIYVLLLRLPTTIKVNIWPALISVPLGIGLGVIAALKKNTMVDHIISTVVMIFISIPSFIVITLLMSWLCYKTGWLPTQWPSSGSDIGLRIKGYILPTMALSFGSICGYCRFTRAELTEVMGSDFLLLARTKGLTKSQSITRHAMKNAMVPILPSILSEIIALLGGSMILEQLYGIPGVGRLYVYAINMKDWNVLMVDMAFYTIIGLLSGVFLDLSYGFIDPRIRMGAKKQLWKQRNFATTTHMEMSIQQM